MDNIPYGISLVYYLEQTHRIYSVAHKTPINYVVWDESLHHFLSEKGWNEYVKFLIQQNFLKNLVKLMKLYVAVYIVNLRMLKKNLKLH